MRCGALLMLVARQARNSACNRPVPDISGSGHEGLPQPPSQPGVTPSARRAELPGSLPWKRSREEISAAWYVVDHADAARSSTGVVVSTTRSTGTTARSSATRPPPAPAGRSMIDSVGSSRPITVLGRHHRCRTTSFGSRSARSSTATADARVRTTAGWEVTVSDRPASGAAGCDHGPDARLPARTVEGFGRGRGRRPAGFARIRPSRRSRKPGSLAWSAAPATIGC
jgi:hypothetical protein